MNEWMEIVRRYNFPDRTRSIWQIVNSLVPYVLLWYLMYLSLSVSYWITLGLSVLAAGFLVRIFIIFHDCGHGSFFKSSSASRIIGTILGSLVFTPYEFWTNDHARHHQTVGNLDKRGHGDVWTATREEYTSMSRRKQILYRIYRHPVVLFLIGPFFFFVVFYRIPRKKMTTAERRGIHISNLVIATWVTGAILLIGWKAYLMIQLPVIYLATSAGVWLFYVQHQFEDTIWTRQTEWDYKKMALEGSSYMKFPKLLQWFSGNIGFHHIHHLSPKIPNYKLEQCYRENDLLRQIRPVTFWPSLKTMRLRLWDEAAGKLISFKQFRSSYQTG
jgi:omega-6 fatty acid desaturase (delta-12 desaturase)